MTRSTVLAQPVHRAVGDIAAKHLGTASTALARLKDPKDSESLHDFRVSVRRLRSLLRAYEPWMRRSAAKKVQRALRELGRATNAGRDAEVHIAWLERQRDRLRRRDRAGLNWLLRKLRRIKRSSYLKARRVVRGDFQRAETLLRKRLPQDASGTPVPFGAAVGTLLEAHAGDLKAKLSSVRSADDEEHAHQARISAKRLRYLLEPLTDVLDDAKGNVKQLKRLQDILGELHDMHVLADTLRSALQDVAAEKTRRMHDLAVEGRMAEVERERRRDERLGLITLAGLVRENRDQLFSRLDADWLHGRAPEFTASLQAQGVAIAAAHSADREIERKFLLSAVPDAVRHHSSGKIDQGWLPGEKLQERLRRISQNGTDEWLRTVKLGSGLQRLEFEERTTREMFDVLWPLTEGHRIAKRRYRVPVDDLVWEIDEFLDRDLVLAEVELSDPTAPLEVPGWLTTCLVREVTGDPTYDNVNLAR